MSGGLSLFCRWSLLVGGPQVGPASRGTCTESLATALLLHLLPVPAVFHTGLLLELFDSQMYIF